MKVAKEKSIPQAGIELATLDTGILKGVVLQLPWLSHPLPQTVVLSQQSLPPMALVIKNKFRPHQALRRPSQALLCSN